MIIVITVNSEVCLLMIVCLCHGVSDRVIDDAIDDGCASLRQIGRNCKAGTDCGACRSDIKERLRDAEHDRGSVMTSALFPVVSVV
jgi:bacterioferritin-associated ferredoxin